MITGEKTPTLRSLLEKGPVFAPTAWDCFSAKVLQKTGYQAMCISGAEVAESHCGLPDLGLVSFDELLDVVTHIADTIPIPMIVDIDTGFGNELNVMRTCERIAKAGAMAVHLEDQTFPKRCGHMRGKDVIPAKDYFSKVKAAHHVLKDTDCLLIARTDSYNILGLEEAIYRNLGSLEAGADISFTESIDCISAMEEIGRRVPGWKMFAMSAGGCSPKLPFKDVVDMGFNLITAHILFSGAYRGMYENAINCKEDNSDLYAFKHDILHVPMGSFEMFGIHDWLSMGQRFNPDIKSASKYELKEE